MAAPGVAFRVRIKAGEKVTPMVRAAVPAPRRRRKRNCNDRCFLSRAKLSRDGPEPRGQTFLPVPQSAGCPFGLMAGREFI